MADRPVKVWLPALRTHSGTDVFTIRLAKGLRHHGVDAEISWFDRRYEFFPDLLKRFPAPMGTQIIHANSWNAFAFKRKNIPLIVTEHHCVLDPRFQPFTTFLQRLYYKTVIARCLNKSFADASMITCVSNCTAQGLQMSFGIKNALVIQNGIDTNFFDPSPINSDVSAKKTFRLLFVGNLSRRKGADLLPRLMKNLGSQFELRYTSGLRKSKELLTSSNCIALGRLSMESLRDEYRACDALLFPTRFEGFGYAAAEAMSCGKPVIGFAGHALDELIANEKTGFLVPLDDMEALEVACRELASHSDVCHRLGEAARHEILTRFSENKFIDLHISLYNSILI